MNTQDMFEISIPGKLLNSWWLFSSIRHDWEGEDRLFHCSDIFMEVYGSFPGGTNRKEPATMCGKTDRIDSPCRRILVEGMAAHSLYSA